MSIINATEVEFLGFKIKKNSIRSSERRSQSIVNFEVPKTEKQH